jgi:ferredoxin
MKVSVDLELCQGHAVCVRVAPLVFDLDEDTGQSSVRIAELVALDLVDKALLAAEGCPERAIMVE